MLVGQAALGHQTFPLIVLDGRSRKLNINEVRGTVR